MSHNGSEIILSLAFNYHDSNCAISLGAKILGVLEVERLFRSKRISVNISQMELASSYLLSQHGFTINNVDYLVVNALKNPFETSEEREDIRYTIYKFLGKKLPAMVVRHHLAHAGHYFFSTLEKALIASCDGGGDLGERVAYFIGDGLSLKRVEIDSKCHTSTKPYGQASAFLYDEPFAEGKLMALAAYGKKDSEIQCRFKNLILKLKDVPYRTGQSLLCEYFPQFQSAVKSDLHLASQFAFAVQSNFIEKRLEDILSIFDSYVHQALVIVGGAALNLELNSRIWQTVSKNIFIPPNPDDTGVALGQLAVAIVKKFNSRPVIDFPYIGVAESEQSAEKYLLSNVDKNSIEVEPQKAARRIMNGEICLSHYSRPEVGPRALGHRSFLTSCNSNMTKRISVDIKRREPCRPVAPIVLENEAKKYFTDGPDNSPYMLFSYKALRNTLLDEVKGIVHIDETARLQTVNEQQDVHLSQILAEVGKISGFGMLANTSLNFKGYPNSHFMSDTVDMLRKINYPAFVYYPSLENI